MADAVAEPTMTLGVYNATLYVQYNNARHCVLGQVLETEGGLIKEVHLWTTGTDNAQAACISTYLT